MKRLRLVALALLFVVTPPAFGGTIVNTNGSDEGVAINGFDTVALFSEKKAVSGNPQYSVEWMGAVWRFASEANMELFKADPTRYAPQYGGHCTWGISENAISKKPFAGAFDVIDGKLYLFAVGNKSPQSARTSFWQTGGGAVTRIADADKNWPRLKARLERR